MRRVHSGPIVVMSTNSTPSRAAGTITSCTCGPSTTIEKTTSASCATSAGDAATVAPCSCAHASAVDVVRFHTVSSWPARRRFAACREPMMPRPIHPRFMRREATSAGHPDPRPDEEEAWPRARLSNPSKPVAVCDRRSLRARAHVELGEDPRDVDARGLLGHEQPLADLAVRRALGDHREHLALARHQAERVAGLALDVLGLGVAALGQGEPGADEEAARLARA